MTEEKGLSNVLRAIVLEHGIENVERTLGQIRKSTARRKSRGSQLAPSNQIPKSCTGQPKKTKITALEYVSKLDVDHEIKVLLKEAASEYESKSFLPTVGEIKNFCVIQGINVPASHSRATAIPRIFKHLSQLSPQEIRSMLQSRVFSGPTRLAPIADAIRRSSEQRVSEDTVDRKVCEPLPNKKEVKEKEKEKDILKPSSPKNI